MQTGISVELCQLPRRRLIVKRGVNARDYFSYCEEMGCDVWELLLHMPGRVDQPLCLWLPKAMRAPHTSEYVMGVEVSQTAVVPEGFSELFLPTAAYLKFQGPPFADEAFCQAIGDVQKAMAAYDPAALGFVWDEDNPRIQLEPIGECGYVEMRAVKSGNNR